ncbi:hypothetical protein SEA_CELAENA_49 [Microbacterium phage Celaena]|uniref:hypothetical protein n=1 Tax=Microbacterium phage Celaena TaxID=2591214 RepID=UPI001163CD1F|nr:hypothetical protein QDW17_gp49 [Microbacterium phage Celaena]QDH92428.1 hypothetical protein SEA_CELAENA_49 [Microbacterium phage Celaena]
MKTLTIAEVTEALDQLIIERGPNYVYPDAGNGENCFYSFEDGTPGCVVGAVLAKVAPEAFEELVVREAPQDDGNGAVYRPSAGNVAKVVKGAEWPNQPIEQLAPYWLVEAESPVLGAALRDLQTAQDCGDTWEQAREAFVRRLRSA